MFNINVSRQPDPSFNINVPVQPNPDARYSAGSAEFISAKSKSNKDFNQELNEDIQALTAKVPVRELPEPEEVQIVEVERPKKVSKGRKKKKKRAVAEEDEPEMPNILESDDVQQP